MTDWIIFWYCAHGFVLAITLFLLMVCWDDPGDRKFAARFFLTTLITWPLAPLVLPLALLTGAGYLLKRTYNAAEVSSLMRSITNR